jgi:hypothetical protein
MIRKLLNLIESLSDEKGVSLKIDVASKKPLGRLPMWLSPLEKEISGLHAPRVKRVNRYLAYQESRLLDLKAQQKFDELILRWCILLKNSKSYQTVLYTQVDKG